MLQSTCLLLFRDGSRHMPCMALQRLQGFLFSHEYQQNQHSNSANSQQDFFRYR